MSEGCYESKKKFVVQSNVIFIERYITLHKFNKAHPREYEESSIFKHLKPNCWYSQENKPMLNL